MINFMRNLTINEIENVAGGWTQGNPLDSLMDIGEITIIGTRYDNLSFSNSFDPIGFANIADVNISAVQTIGMEPEIVVTGLRVAGTHIDVPALAAILGGGLAGA